ncbi:MAG TPA: GAF domain-containing protein, partial [Anaerolineales bacterium]|nr:GAF domain-containing protein [Anaerolineales bacterium]
VSIIVLSFALAYLAFDNYGLSGDGRIWLMFFSVFTTIMLGLRYGIIANIIGLGAFVGVGYLVLNGFIQVKNQIGIGYSLDPQAWLTTGITFAFVSLLLSIAIGLLIRSLEIGRSSLQNAYEDTQQLTEQLQNEEQRLLDRSSDLERRLVQIRTAAEISRSLGTILDPKELLNTVADLIQTRFNLYYVGVFLIDEFSRYAILQAGTGEAGQTMLSENHRLSIGGSSMVGWATSHNEPRISMDVEQEAVRFKNPHLPLTRSELAIPIAIGKQVLGAISVQSVEPNAFDDDDITILNSIGDSLAIALENARLFQQFENSLAEIQQLNRQYMSKSWKQIWLNAEEKDQELTYEHGSDLILDEGGKEISIPLTLRGDQVIGNISLATSQNDLTSEEKDFIQAISDQAALALESARLLDEANKRVEQELAIQELTTQFSRSLDFDSLLKSVVQELGQLPNIKQASIHVTPPERQKNPASPDPDAAN